MATPSRHRGRLLLASIVLGLTMLGAYAIAIAPVAGATTTTPVTITDYTDPGQALTWGYRSQWKQPWRSYLDTTPATKLLDAIGINFNIPTHKTAMIRSTARLLGDSGFKRARIEVGWNSLDYDNPDRITEYNREGLEATLVALRENGIRPLILLNANSSGPCPVKTQTIDLTEPAPKGSTVIHIDPSDVDKVVPGKTGLRSGGTAANYLFSSVEPDGTVHLSAPLGEIWQSDRTQPVVSSLPAGPVEVETLLYEPFRQPTLPDGSHNPAFEPTMEGWLNYVGVVTKEVKSILGSEEFDVEVWNELSFGSRFLNISAYYKPNIQPWSQSWDEREILQRTVAYLRDPAHGVPNVGIGNGFANESPAWSGTESPAGLTAIDKHPYHGWDSYPGAAQVNGNRPLNGLGEPAGWVDQSNQWHESFTPSYQSFFPEYFLSGLQTETLVHDLSPAPSTTGSNVLHGRLTHPSGAAPPAYWITEVNMDPASGPAPRSSMSAADIRHVESKDVLRYLAAYVNKGVTALDFYAAQAGNLSLVDSTFFSAVKAAPATYPGDAAGGETTSAVERLVSAMKGAEPIESPRSLSLAELTDYSGNLQFGGNGTAGYPALYNREVFGFFPFQVNAHRFVIPLYVMTRNVVENHDPGSSSPSRFDLPPEPYRLRIAGVDGTDSEVTATDPLTGESVPVQVLEGDQNSVTVKLDVTDSPRLLTIQETSEENETPSGGPTDPTPEEVPPSPEPPGEPAPEPPSDPSPEPPLVPGSENSPPTSQTGDGSGSTPPASHGASHSAPEEGRGAQGADLPNVRLVLRSRSTLIHRGRLTALVTCSPACSPDVEGTVRIGRRSFRMRPSGPNPKRRLLGSDTRAQVVLSTAGGGPEVVQEALRRGERVTVAVAAYLGGGGGPPAASKSLVLSPGPTGDRRR